MRVAVSRLWCGGVEGSFWYYIVRTRERARGGEPACATLMNQGMCDAAHAIRFGRQVYIDREDFSEDPPKGFFRLKPGGEVRLKFAYVVTCNEVVKDAEGKVTELKCAYNEDTRAGNTPEGMKKVKGIIQWVSKDHGVPCQVRLYDRLFSTPLPGKDHEDGDFLKDLNPDSLKIIDTGLVEPSIADVAPGSHVQFERVGYFYSDPLDSKPGQLVFNRVVTLRDNWSAASASAPG